MQSLKIKLIRLVLAAFACIALTLGTRAVPTFAKGTVHTARHYITAIGGPIGGGGGG